MRFLQIELDQFFAHTDLPDGRIAQDGAFRIVCKKLKASAFTELNQFIVVDVPTTARWHGYHVLAADSTTLKLPTTHPDMHLEDKGFNCLPNPGGLYSLARGAGLCDTTVGPMLRADIASDAKSERDMLVEQLEQVKCDDLLVLDRGYPSYWLFALLNQLGHTFCMWLTTSFNPQVRAFVTSDRASDIVTIKPNKEQLPSFDKHLLPIKSFPLRLAAQRAD